MTASSGVTGSLVPVKAPDELGRVLAGYASDPHQRALHGKAARQRAIDEFSLERMTGRYAELYRAVAQTDRV